MGLRDLIKTKIDPDETLLGLKLTWTRNGVKIDPDETLLGLKLTRTRHRLDLIRAKMILVKSTRTRPDKKPLLGLKSRPEMPVLSGPFYPPPLI